MVLSVLQRYETYLYSPAYVRWKEEKRKEEEALDRKGLLLFSLSFCNIYSDISHIVEVKHTIMLLLESLKLEFGFPDLSGKLMFIYSK